MKKKKSFIFFISIIFLIGVFSIVVHKLIFTVLSGRVSFPKNNVNLTLTMEDGQKFTVLRTLHIENKNNSANSNAVFIVRFKFKGFEFETNKRLSIIPAPFPINMDGFIEKDWTFNNATGEFQGIYQWRSETLANNYPDSFVFRIMTKRAAPGTVNYKILPNTNLAEYLKKLAAHE